METKKSTPTEIKFTKEYDGQKGKIYYYDIKFENGDFGSFSTNKSPQVKFEVGKELEYTIEITEEKKKDGSGTWTKRAINVPKKDFSGGGAAPGKRWQDPEKNPRIARTVALDAAIEIEGMGELPEDFKFLTIYKILFDYITETAIKNSKNGSYDEGAAIASQSAIKQTIHRYKQNNKKPESLDEFFKVVNYFFKLIFVG